jgi:hypothetical protein
MAVGIYEPWQQGLAAKVNGLGCGWGGRARSSINDATICNRKRANIGRDRKSVV